MFRSLCCGCFSLRCVAASSRPHFLDPDNHPSVSSGSGCPPPDPSLLLFCARLSRVKSAQRSTCLLWIISFLDYVAWSFDPILPDDINIFSYLDWFLVQSWRITVRTSTLESCLSVKTEGQLRFDLWLSINTWKLTQLYSWLDLLSGPSGAHTGLAWINYPSGLSQTYELQK